MDKEQRKAFWERIKRKKGKRPPPLSKEEHNKRFTGVTSLDTLTDEQYEAIYHRPRPQ